MQANVNAYIQLLRKQFIDEIIKNPPAIVIDTSPSGYYGYDKFPLKNFSALYELINNNYRFAKRIDMMDIYVHKNITMHHTAIITDGSNCVKTLGKN
jgi:transcription elongation factor GreA-like protein